MKTLVDRSLRQIIDDGIIKHTSADATLHEYIQPASIDLPIGDNIYHVKQKFLPFQRTAWYIAEKLAVQTFTTDNDVILYKWQTYVIPCLDVQFPDHLSWKISPKSSIGRIDVLVRAIVDNTWLYDSVLPGTKWQVWLEVTPQSFNIAVKKWVALSQLMVCDRSDQQPPLSREALEPESFLFSSDKETITSQRYEDTMMVWVELESDIIGYKAIYTNRVINLSNIWWHESRHFFAPVYKHRGSDHHKMTLEAGRFYILMTKEHIRIPPQYSVELAPFSHLMGELRVHYAWFFDPWFGGETGAVWVLEIRSHEDLIIYDGQPIVLVKVYENDAIPEKLYGQNGNNYHLQEWPKLAKFFV